MEVMILYSLLKYEHDMHEENFVCNPLLDNLKFNSLPNDKISDWSKFKAYADDKINVT